MQKNGTTRTLHTVKDADGAVTTVRIGALTSWPIDEFRARRA